MASTKKIAAISGVVVVSCTVMFIYILLSKTSQPQATDQTSVANFKILNGLNPRDALFTPRNHVHGFFAPVRSVLKC